MTDEQTYIASVKEHLGARDVKLEPGLTEAEAAEVEARYGFEFPPDLRSLLQAVLPVAPEFPDWRAEPEDSLRQRLDWPREGLLFDVEHGQLWLPEWGERPEAADAAVAAAREQLSQVPRLIPVYSNHYLPAEPSLAGNPVFSIKQSDIIYYGLDLTDYLEKEFGIPNPWGPPPELRPIRFWSRLTS